MTKQEVRAAALANWPCAPPIPCGTWGAGTGSVSVELALAAPQGHVYAVECEPDACAPHPPEPRKNLRRGTSPSLRAVPPAALEALPAPDAVFIGGTKGSMAAVVDTVLAKKNANARICIAAIALESLSAAIAALTAHGLSAEVTQLAVSRTRPAGQAPPADRQQPHFSDHGRTQMMQFVIAAPRSGSGKTTVTCALLAALKKKAGHGSLRLQERAGLYRPHVPPVGAGVESHNLDLYLSAKNTVRNCTPTMLPGTGLVCEGAMGFLRWAGPDHPRQCLGAGRCAGPAGTVGGTAQGGPV